MSIRPQRSSAVVRELLDGGLVGDVGGDPDSLGERGGGLLRALEVGDDDPRALARESLCERPADPLCGSGDERDLAVEGAHQRSGENDVGTRILFACVWISGWIFARNAFQSSRACSRARRSDRSSRLS